MIYRTTARFDRDLRGLDPIHRMAFLDAMERFLAAADGAAAGSAGPWPRGMRVKRLSGTRGIWEMTWSMRNPDGRATWEWVGAGDEPAILWRRVGDHSVLKRP